MGNKTELNEGDYRMVNYFHFEKDIESWAEWEQAKPLFEKKHPELMDAIRRLKSAQITLDIIVRNLEQ